MQRAATQCVVHPRIAQLAELGQSLWCDQLSRNVLRSGALPGLIDEGIVGVTSNPTIFEKAINGSEAYAEDIARLAAEGHDVDGVYEGLVFADIVEAADLLRATYDRTERRDGFVSIEVSPLLADDTDGTIAQARHIYHNIGRPNVMIKVPGTEAGLPAITTLIGEGINVNVTLIFAVDVYAKVAGAYVAGLRRWIDGGGKADQVASVASFFVSRVDTAVDKLIAGQGDRSLDDLRGRAAIANSKIAYARFKEIFGGPEFAPLAERGARVQRPLWASTSTKNPAYADTMYVDGLIGPDTVNTAPPGTLEAFKDHGRPARTVDVDVDGERRVIARLEAAGIHMTHVTDRLRIAGVKAFADSFTTLMSSLRRKIGR